jgi:hypothetical protein
LQCLGGKPLVCEGMKLCFYPVQAQKTTGSAERLTIIELVVDKKKSRTAANIRRTPFEEENYLSSAWSRPQHVSFALGPRSIRVLGPEPGLVITDLSSDVTRGHALDGTVNRILLQFQADRGETCESLAISASCFSVLITPTGATKRLVSEQEMMSPETENSLNETDVRYRTPILVEELPPSSKFSPHHANGFALPSGWTTSGSGQKKTSTISSLKQGQTTLYAMDFYRPSIKHVADSSDDGKFSDDRLGDVSICKTDYYLTIKYKQLRHRDKKTLLKRTRRRPSRRRPVMPSRCSSDNNEASTIEATGSGQEGADCDDYEDVSLEYSGSICWVNPLIAKFDHGTQQPSGIRQSNHAQHFKVIDGSRISVRCTLSRDPAIENLRTEIVSVAVKVGHTLLLNDIH